jgi:Transglutaminase-like superfamily
MRTTGWLGVLLLAGALASAARGGDDEVVSDDWYAHFHKEVKAGWDHTRRLRSKVDGKVVWVTEHESRIIRFMDGSLLKSPMTSSVSIGMPTDPQKREGTVKDGVITAVEDGKSRTVPYPAGALGPAAIDRAIKAELKPGATGSVVAFKTIGATAEETNWKVEGMTEVSNVLGRYMWLTRVEKTDDMGIPDVLLYGPGGREFAGATNFGLHQWLLTEEPVAKFDGTPASLLFSRIVASDRAIDVTSRPLSAVLRLTRKGGFKKPIPEEGGQRIVARGKDGSVDVAVSAAEPPEGTVILGRPYAGKADMKRFLAATPMVELEHPRLQSRASEAIHGLINALRCAREIESVVRQTLQPAPADVGFATACEAISSSTGDSTEYAVLAVAYARSVGLPARLVAGFVYWDASTWKGEPRPLGAFAFHAWAEVLIAEGTWYPIDPIRVRDAPGAVTVDDLAGFGGFDATHVAVLKSDLATSTPVTDVVLPVLEFMDGLTIEVVEPAAPR